MRAAIYIKKICACIMAVVMSTILLMDIPSLAKSVEKYPYTIFASSDEEGAITVSTNNFCLNGSIATNGTIVSSGVMNINGSITEHAEQEMIYIFNAIENAYFNDTDYDKYESNYILKEQNINIEVPLEVSGEISLDGNINLNTAVKALDSITINGEIKNTNSSIIFSKYGDITINSTNVNLNGLVYAPFGSVEITSQNLGLNNVIIIAEKVMINCSSVNVNYSDDMAEFVAENSEELVIPDDEKHYLDDKDIFIEENSTEESSEEENSEEEEINDEYSRYEYIISDFDNWDQYTDTDGDGLPDELEEFIGSRSDLVDTDGDGLSDYYEYVILGTSPVLVDTDNNGINDDEEDFDSDGLSNIEEYEYETIPWEKDTDEDGIEDGEEIFIYGTDPLIPDTDGDGMLDGEEQPLGFDPANPDTDGDGILDGDEVFEQEFVHNVENTECVIKKIIIDTEISGSLETSTTIKSIMGKDYGCSNVYGLVGEPFEIETSSEFETATLTFEVDTSELGETDFNDLIILWYDEENGMYIELDTAYDEVNGTVSTETTHFSKYMLVDGKKWLEGWSVELDYGEDDNQEDDTAYYTSLVIDYTVPVEYKDIDLITEKDNNILLNGLTNYHQTYNPICQQIAESLIAAMGEYDKMSIIFNTKGITEVGQYTNNADVLSERFNDYDFVIADGWTYDDIEVDESLYVRRFETYLALLLSTQNPVEDIEVERRMIFVTGCSSTIPEEVITFAKQRGVKIYTISIGDYTSNASLIHASDYTGGLYYHLSLISDLQELLDWFNINYSLQTDTDGDGLPDIVEINGMRNQDGIIVYTDPYNPDTDGDGLTDGEEVDPTMRYKLFSTGINNLNPMLPSNPSYYYMQSDPNSIDTDGDGYTDYEEVKEYHSSPRYNDVEIYSLNNDYISVDAEVLVEQSKDAADIATRKYGGCQGWFLYYSELNEKQDTLKEYGCGLISPCDILLYMAKYNDEYVTEQTQKAVLQGNGRYSFTSYMKYTTDMEASYFAIKETSRYDGINGLDLAKGMNAYFKDYNIDFSASWCVSKNKLYSRVVEMIENDIPVPIAANGLKSKYDELDKEDRPYLFMYSNSQLDYNITNYDYLECLESYNDSFTKYDSKFNSHYANITGVVVDDVSDEIWLRVSSWGKSLYVNYDEYMTYMEKYASFGSATTNIIYIEKNK